MDRIFKVCTVQVCALMSEWPAAVAKQLRKWPGRRIFSPSQSYWRVWWKEQPPVSFSWISIALWLKLLLVLSATSAPPPPPGEPTESQQQALLSSSVRSACWTSSTRYVWSSAPQPRRWISSMSSNFGLIFSMAPCKRLSLWPWTSHQVGLPRLELSIWYVESEPLELVLVL